MEGKLDHLSTMVATGFAEIQQHLVSFSAALSAVNSTKGEKVVDQNNEVQDDQNTVNPVEKETQGGATSKGSLVVRGSKWKKMEIEVRGSKMQMKKDSMVKS